MNSSVDAGNHPRGPNEVLIVLAVLIAAWESLGRVFNLRPDTLPTPSRILLEAWRNYPLLLESGFASFLALARGLGAALAFALALLLSCASYRPQCRVIERILAAAQAIPFLAAVPVLVVWFGYKSAPEVLVIFLVSFPFCGARALGALRSMPSEILEFAEAMQASRLDVTTKLQLPWVVPALLHSLKAAITMSVAAATAAEFVLAEVGLGALMMRAVSNLNTPLLLAGFLCATAMAVILIGAVRLAERFLVPLGSSTS